MIKMFNDLDNCIIKLIELSENAKYHLTEDSIAKGSPSVNILAGWNQFIQGMKNNYPPLKTILIKQIEDIDKRELDHCLGPFRSLSRHFSEVSCYWSAYYDDICDALDKVSSCVEKIEVKYTLGNEKLRQMERNRKK